MYEVYAISSSTRNYIYVGMTSDLDSRLHRHIGGYERTTRPYRPFSIIYTKQFPTRAEARVHEKYLKSGSGKEMLKQIRETQR